MERGYCFLRGERGLRYYRPGAKVSVKDGITEIEGRAPPKADVMDEPVS